MVQIKTPAFEDIYASLSVSLPCKSTSTNDPEQEQSLSFVREIVTKFVKSLEYRPEDFMKETRTTYQSLCSEFSVYNNTSDRWFELLCLQASTLAEFCYPDHPAEIQLLAARFTWFMIYVDDLGQKMPSSLEAFQQSVLVPNESPDGAVLQALREHLTDMYKLYDSMQANFITLSAIDYINGCLLEEMPIIRNMPLSKAAHSWPYYLRAKTGISAAYAFMLFPKTSSYEMSVYIQAIEDMGFVMNFINDVLSFYKEFLAGETNNYVYNRAHVTGRSIPDTLQDIVDDTLAANARIMEILQSTDALIPWKRFVNGMVAFHFSLERYRLSDLGF